MEGGESSAPAQPQELAQNFDNWDMDDIMGWLCAMFDQQPQYFGNGEESVEELQRRYTYYWQAIGDLLPTDPKQAIRLYMMQLARLSRLEQAEPEAQKSLCLKLADVTYDEELLRQGLTEVWDTDPIDLFQQYCSNVIPGLTMSSTQYEESFNARLQPWNQPANLNVCDQYIERVEPLPTPAEKAIVQSLGQGTTTVQRIGGQQIVPVQHATSYTLSPLSIELEACPVCTSVLMPVAMIPVIRAHYRDSLLIYEDWLRGILNSADRDTLLEWATALDLHLLQKVPEPSAEQIRNAILMQHETAYDDLEQIVTDLMGGGKGTLAANMTLLLDRLPAKEREKIKEKVQKKTTVNIDETPEQLLRADPILVLRLVTDVLSPSTIGKERRVLDTEGSAESLILQLRGYQLYRNQLLAELDRIEFADLEQLAQQLLGGLPDLVNKLPPEQREALKRALEKDFEEDPTLLLSKAPAFVLRQIADSLHIPTDQSTEQIITQIGQLHKGSVNIKDLLAEQPLLQEIFLKKREDMTLEAQRAATQEYLGKVTSLQRITAALRDFIQNPSRYPAQYYRFLRGNVYQAVICDICIANQNNPSISREKIIQNLPALSMPLRELEAIASERMIFRPFIDPGGRQRGEGVETINVIYPYDIGAPQKPITEETPSITLTESALTYRTPSWMDTYLGPYGLKRGALVIYFLPYVMPGEGAPIGMVVGYDAFNLSDPYKHEMKKEDYGQFPTRLVIKPVFPPPLSDKEYYSVPIGAVFPFNSAPSRQEFITHLTTISPAYTTSLQSAYGPISDNIAYIEDILAQERQRLIQFADNPDINWQVEKRISNYESTINYLRRLRQSLASVQQYDTIVGMARAVDKMVLEQGLPSLVEEQVRGSVNKYSPALTAQSRNVIGTLAAQYLNMAKNQEAFESVRTQIVEELATENPYVQEERTVTQPTLSEQKKVFTAIPVVAAVMRLTGPIDFGEKYHREVLRDVVYAYYAAKLYGKRTLGPNQTPPVRGYKLASSTWFGYDDIAPYWNRLFGDAFPMPAANKGYILGSTFTDGLLMFRETSPQERLQFLEPAIRTQANVNSILDFDSRLLTDNPLVNSTLQSLEMFRWQPIHQFSLLPGTFFTTDPLAQPFAQVDIVEKPWYVRLREKTRTAPDQPDKGGIIFYRYATELGQPVTGALYVPDLQNSPFFYGKEPNMALLNLLFPPADQPLLSADVVRDLTDGYLDYRGDTQLLLPHPNYRNFVLQATEAGTGLPYSAILIDASQIQLEHQETQKQKKRRIG